MVDTQSERRRLRRPWPTWLGSASPCGGCIAPGATGSGLPNTSALDQLSPAFPGRAAWGTAARLRAWQVAALRRYRELDPVDFLAVATPGAGKTTFALRVATELLAQRRIEQVIVVTPTEHLKVQWADAASKVGLHLDPCRVTPSGAVASNFMVKR